MSAGSQGPGRNIGDAVSRGEGGAALGPGTGDGVAIPAITPGCLMWLRKSARLMLPAEHAAVQGHISVAGLSSDNRVKELVGQSVNSISMVQFLVSVRSVL